MGYPVHLKILSKVPNWNHARKNACKKKIQEIMQKYNYDEDFIGNVNEDFCKGFETARDIIVGILEEEYWRKQENNK